MSTTLSCNGKKDRKGGQLLTVSWRVSSWETHGVRMGRGSNLGSVDRNALYSSSLSGGR